jgi:cytochrome c
MKKIVVLALIVLFSGFVVLAYAQEEKTKMDLDPAKELAKSVENGKKLFNDKSLGTSGMTCNPCHVKYGTKAGKMGEMSIPPFDNLGAKYPKFFMTAKRVMTLDQVINWCIMMPLKGKPLVWDDSKLTDLTAYCASVKPMTEEKEK